MIQIDDSLLLELGLGALPAPRRKELLKAFYEELQLRVGTELSNRFDEEQLDEFGRLMEAGDDRAAIAFLEQHVPDRDEVVRREHARLRAAVDAATPRLLRAAGIADNPASAEPLPPDAPGAAELSGRAAVASPGRSAPLPSAGGPARQRQQRAPRSGASPRSRPAQAR